MFFIKSECLAKINEDNNRNDGFYVLTYYTNKYVEDRKTSGKCSPDFRAPTLLLDREYLARLR